MEQEQTFNLVPVVDASTNKYVIANYETMKSLAQAYIEQNVHDVEITDAEHNKIVKETRAEINHKIEAVSRARIDISKLLIEDFENQCKELESILKAGELICKKRVDEWTAKNKPVVAKIPTKTLTIKVNETAEEMKKLAKVQAFAEKLGLVVVVK